jgi:GxxExxY protein
MLKAPELETLIELTFNTGMKIHQDVGPGLIESVYERVLADQLRLAGVKVERQKPL